MVLEGHVVTLLTTNCIDSIHADADTCRLNPDSLSQSKASKCGLDMDNQQCLRPCMSAGQLVSIEKHPHTVMHQVCHRTSKLNWAIITKIGSGFLLQTLETPFVTRSQEARKFSHSMFYDGLMTEHARPVLLQTQ